MVCIHNLQLTLHVVLQLIAIAWQQHKPSQGQSFDDIVAALQIAAPLLLLIFFNAQLCSNGKGQARLWKSLFTTSCLAVWSRSQRLLQWNEPRTHHLILFLWTPAALQWHQRERYKHTVFNPPLARESWLSQEDVQRLSDKTTKNRQQHWLSSLKNISRGQGLIHQNYSNIAGVVFLK